MIKIYIPNYFQELNQYSAKIIFDEVFGIKYELNTHSKNNIIIQNGDCDKKIILPSNFTDSAQRFWLDKKHLPTRIKKFSLENTIFKSLKTSHTDIPILFGDNRLEIKDKYIKIDVDIFGTVFFMLSRYEELFPKKLDIHKRFRLEETIAFKNNFLHRPIVNEYIEIFWLLIKHLWPSLKRKKRQYKSVVSCDVDHPFDDATDSIIRISRRFVARIIRDRNISLAFSDLKCFIQKKMFGKNYDNYTDNIYWMMDLADSKEIKLQFNFIPLNTGSKIDTKYTLEKKEVVKIFMDIIERNRPSMSNLVDNLSTEYLNALSKQLKANDAHGKLHSVVRQAASSGITAKQLAWFIDVLSKDYESGSTLFTGGEMAEYIDDVESIKKFCKHHFD